MVDGETEASLALADGVAETDGPMLPVADGDEDAVMESEVVCAHTAAIDATHTSTARRMSGHFGAGRRCLGAERTPGIVCERGHAPLRGGAQDAATPKGFDKKNDVACSKMLQAMKWARNQ